MRRISEALARFTERWPWLIIVIAVLISAAAVPGLTMLETETGFTALVDSDAKIALDNDRYEAQFGEEPVTILLTGRLDDIFSSGNLEVLGEFERRIAADSRYLSVQSPLIVLNSAGDAVNRARQNLEEQVAAALEEAAEAAQQAAAAMGLDEAQQELAAEQARADVMAELQPQLDRAYAIGEPVVDNPLFVDSVFYDENGAVSTALAPFVPDDEHVLVLVTPRGNMSDEESLQATVDIESFFDEFPLEQVDTTIISSSKLVDAISAGIGNNIKILLGLSVLVMIIILVFLFRVRWRLLSLIMVGIATLWTFGLMGYFKVPLTMATMAVLPILIGLGIDFSIQFHNRYQEELTRSSIVADAVIASVTRMFPVVGIALLATIIGFITLFISDVPMIREFGMMLAIGIAISYIVGLFLLHSIVYLGDKRVPIKRLSKDATKASGRIERILGRIGRLALRHTLWIFIVSLLFAVGGGIADNWLPTNTDYEELMPQDTPALVELRELREIVGTGGTATFMIEADDVTDPEILKWMKRYQEEALASHPELRSYSSPAALVAESAGGVIPPREQINEILDGTPAFYLQRLVTGDRSAAVLSFDTAYISMEETHDLLQLMLEEAAPPEGVTISSVGTIALGTATVDNVVGARGTMNVLCLSAVFIVLLLVYRRLGNTVFTMIPVGAVIAWSSLDMFIIGIPLNPLTAILGVLVIGICTEFMVLLNGRYEEEKSQGLSPNDAMVTAISKIGRAIVTTALTTVGGFGVLIVSDFVMIRDFGIATVVGVFLCLLITLTVMPGLIVWWDNWRRKRAARHAS